MYTHIYIYIFVHIYIYIYHDSVDLSSKIMISMAASPGSLQSADPRSVRNAGAARTRNAAGSVEGNSRPVGPTVLPWWYPMVPHNAMLDGTRDYPAWL